jgi:hypothetical protein
LRSTRVISANASPKSSCMTGIVPQWHEHLATPQPLRRARSPLRW